jgi:hypothetical protein
MKSRAQRGVQVKKTKKPPMPRTPAPDATEAEREAYRAAMRRWCAKYRGVQLSAKGLEQEEYLIQAMSWSPEQQQRTLTAANERVCNLLGNDFTFVWPDEDTDPASAQAGDIEHKQKKEVES